MNFVHIKVKKYFFVVSTTFLSFFQRHFLFIYCNPFLQQFKKKSNYFLLFMFLYVFFFNLWYLFLLKFFKKCFFYFYVFLLLNYFYLNMSNIIFHFLLWAGLSNIFFFFPICIDFPPISINTIHELALVLKP